MHVCILYMHYMPQFKTLRIIHQNIPKSKLVSLFLFAPHFNIFAVQNCVAARLLYEATVSFIILIIGRPRNSPLLFLGARGLSLSIKVKGIR